MDVFCVGHAAWDISVLMEDYPAENSKGETRTLLECGGGPAANAAWLLSSWGASCALAATVGRDVYSDRVVDEFVRAGTDVALVHRSPVDPTPVSIILVNRRTASRTIINRKAAVAASPVRTAADSAFAEPPKVLLFDGHELDASLDAMRLYQLGSAMGHGRSCDNRPTEVGGASHSSAGGSNSRQCSRIESICRFRRSRCDIAADHRLGRRRHRGAHGSRRRRVL
jgi:hypothetical protein